MVAPSDMMDGRWRPSVTNWIGPDLWMPIMAYAAKFASCFTPPVSRRGQFQPAVRRPSVLSDGPGQQARGIAGNRPDVEEGADIIMVKPAMPYLDIISAARERTLLPIAAYQVSGEYSMIKAAAQAGWLDERRAMMNRCCRSNEPVPTLF